MMQKPWHEADLGFTKTRRNKIESERLSYTPHDEIVLMLMDTIKRACEETNSLNDTIGDKQ